MDGATILIPLVGRGLRFRDAGYLEPKPFIPVFGKPMVWWALRTFHSLLQQKAARIVFVLHERDHAYEHTLRALCPPSHVLIVRVSMDTRGQAESALAAEQHVSAGHPLYIFNCDTYSEVALDRIELSGADGVLTYFTSQNPSFSYLRTDADGRVIEVAEKRVISDKASNGLYYFRRAADFFTAAREMLRRGETVAGEYYVMPCYASLIARGLRVIAIPVHRNWILGTPEDLQRFETESDAQDR